jgi:hypothetical protein
VPADLKEGAFRGLQDQKAGFGMFLKVLHVWNISAPSGRIFRKSVKENSRIIKSDKNKGHCT